MKLRNMFAKSGALAASFFFPARLIAPSVAVAQTIENKTPESAAKNESFIPKKTA